MVERYRLWCQDSDAEITREPNGGWVRHSDYEALECQLAEAQAGNAEHSRKWLQAERELLAVKAERDRLAAQVARLREAIAEIQSIAMLAEGNATLSMIGRTARTALASVKE